MSWNILLFFWYFQSVHSGTVIIPGSNTNYSTTCISDVDNATIRARCEIWRDQYSDKEDFVDNCVSTYCEMVIPNAENSDAMAIPTDMSHCKDSNCLNYRLGWGLGVSWDKNIPKVVKITGTKYTTKWILIPFLAFEVKEELSKKMDGREYMETDLFIPDLGEITNVTLFIDTEGKYSSLKQFTYRFIPRSIRIIHPNEDAITDVGYKWQYQGPQFCNEGWTRCSFVVPMTLITHSKYYDLVGPTPKCIERGLCPDRDQFNGYGQTVPSWRERKEFAMTNAARNSAKNFISRYSDGKKPFACDPNKPFENRPYYYSVDATEGCRIKAWDLGMKKCPGEGSSHMTCASTVKIFDLPNNGFTSRVEAFTAEMCLNHCEKDKSKILNREKVYVVPPGLMHKSGAGAAEGIGGGAMAMVLSDPGHCGGLMNHERSMAAIGFYPVSSSWDVKTPMENYAGGVFDYFNDGDWATQPWNNRDLNTYQPIPSGSHFKFTKDDGTEVVRFMSQYYDYDEKPVKKMELVLDGAAKLMNLTLGKSWQGTYEYDWPMPDPSENCHSFFFRAINSKGIFTLPQSGKFQYRTFGIGTCLDDFTSSSCEVTKGTNACQSTCGFPGKPCQSTCGFPGKPCKSEYQPDEDQLSSPSKGNINGIRMDSLIILSFSWFAGMMIQPDYH